MARKRIVSNLHQLTVREILAAPEGDVSDGGGLILRIRGQSASPGLTRVIRATLEVIRTDVGFATAAHQLDRSGLDALWLHLQCNL